MPLKESCITFSKVSKAGDHSRGRPEDSLFNSYYTKVCVGGGRYSFPWIAPLYPQYIRTLYCRVLSKEVSSTIFKVFGMTQPGIELRSPGPLANTLPTRPMWAHYIGIPVTLEFFSKTITPVWKSLKWQKGKFRLRSSVLKRLKFCGESKKILFSQHFQKDYQ